MSVMSGRRDYALGPGPLGVVLHRPDCPKVRAQAKQGLPVMTLINCSQQPDENTIRCECLDEGDARSH